MDDTDRIWNRALGEMLRAARKRQGLTLPQLAGLLNTLTQTVASYEQGKRRPDARRLFELAVILQLPLADMAKQSLAWVRRPENRQLQLPHT